VPATGGRRVGGRQGAQIDSVEYTSGEPRVDEDVEGSRNSGIVVILMSYSGT